MFKRIMNRPVQLFLALAVALVAFDTVQAETDSRPFLVKVHADWCGSCVKLEPVWKEIEANLGDRARTVVFDVTNKGSMQEARETAAGLGLAETFAQYGGRTGTILVVRGDSHEVVKVFKGEYDLAPYEAAIAAATP